ncbi:DUF4123 domain-containing protein [Lonsdalea quercina]|uniref:DUF4123 domain-containing protein n=1 Tax=Lonsdalea quercina TaxID=71657 RepID=UPI003975B622
MNENNSLRLFEIIRNKTSPLYAIIDVMCYPALPDYWRAFHQSAKNQWRQLDSPIFPDALRAVAPIIVELEEGNCGETLLLWTQSQDYGHQGTLLMAADMPLDEMVKYWQQRVVCRGPTGQETLFRSYGPDALALWWATISPEAQVDFLAPARQLFLPAETRESVDYVPLLEEEIFLPATNNYQISLNQTQFDLLTHDNRLRCLANQLFMYVSERTFFLLDIELLRKRFISGIDLAKGLYPRATDAECEAWSAHRWIIGSEFYHHPHFIHLTMNHALGKCIQLFKSEPRHLEDVRARYHRPDWMKGLSPDTLEVTE